MKEQLKRIILIVVGIAFLAACPVRAEIKNPEYLKIRDEMQALYLVQGLLSWFTRVHGERSVFEQSYKGHEDLFTKDNIALTKKLLEDPGLTDEERKAVHFMHNALVLEYVALDTAHFDDEINNAETEATVDLDWAPDPVPYRDLDVMLDQEEDADKRQKLQEAQAKVWDEVLNPIHARQEDRLHELAADLGFASVVDISEDLRNMDLRDLIEKSQKMISETDDMYHEMFAEQVREVMGKEPEEFRRADIGYFASVPTFKKFLPAELAITSFMDFIEGMGLDMKTAAGTEIYVDDEMRPQKEARAACYSMTVPDDVRITVKPSGGIPDFSTFFHESGHALHFGNSVTDFWEFQQLGNNTITETYAIFFEGVWGDPEWLMHYREFVKQYNKFQKPADRVPVMTDEEIGKLIRNRVFWDLYFLRRYNGAKLIYESILHQGDPSLWAGFYEGQTEDLHQVYKTLFSDAYGFQLTDMEALRYRTDVDSFFYSADYARAFVLSMQIDQYMRDNYGPKWFMDPRAGKFMRDLWSRANALQPDELAKILGQDSVDPSVYIATLKYRLAAADRLLKK